MRLQGLFRALRFQRSGVGGYQVLYASDRLVVSWVVKVIWYHHLSLAGSLRILDVFGGLKLN